MFVLYTRRKILCFCCLVVISVLTGCASGPKQLQRQPDHWPTQCVERQLYHTPHAYIYASSKAAAGEADRLVASVIKTFPKDLEIDPGKGLIFVTDRGDPGLVPDFSALLEGSLDAAMLAQSNLTRAQLAEARKEIKDAQEAMEEMDLDMTFVFGFVPFPLDVLTVWPTDLPRQLRTEVTWAISLPTKRSVKRTQKQMFATALEKEEISGFKKMLAKPLLAILEPTIAKAIAQERNHTLTELIVHAQTHLTEARKRSYLAALEEENEKEVSDMMSEMEKSLPQQ